MRLVASMKRFYSPLFAAVFLCLAFPGILETLPSSDPPVILTAPYELGHGTEPDIYVEEGGDIHVAWKDVDVIRYRSKSGSSWGSTETPNIGGVGVSEKSAPSVWADSNGDPHIVWGPEDGPIYYINKVGGSWSSKVTVVPTQSGYTFRDCHIAVGSDGIRHVVWRRSANSDGKGQIWYKKYENGSWGNAVQISQGTTTAKRPHVAMGSNDDFYVVWRQRGGPDNSYEVMYRKWSNGSWGNVEMATYTSAQANEDPHVALDSANNPHVSFPEGTSVAYIKRSGSDWTDPVILGSGVDPTIAIDDNNAIYVAWDDQYKYNTGSGWSGAQVYDDGGYMPDVYGDGQYAHIVYRKNSYAWYVAVSAGGGPPPENWITVTDPNGGEVWEPGTNKNITWTSSEGISTVKIRYSTDSGSTWTTIVESTANDGSYSWTIPDVSSQDCRVRVIDTGDSNVYDVSDADFTIDTGGGGGDSWITLTSPNGGESLPVGSVHDITWESSGDFPYVRLDYSTNGGSTWLVIASKTSNDGSRDWTVPDTPSGRCRVRVQSKADPSVSDMSDADFTIGSGGGQEEWIIATDPNGGEVWEPGTSHDITWTSSEGISTVKIRYSTNSGSTWTTIVSSTANDGSYSWTIPDVSSQNCRVRVIDTGDSNVYDVSDADFTIGAGGGGNSWITLTSPNGGEAWVAGSDQVITWESSDDFPYVRLDYSTNGGSTWIQIASKTANDGSRDWTVPNTPSGRCRVKVQSKADANVSDMSDADFTIVASAGAPGLTLSGGEVPRSFELLQNYPNPFNPSTEIRFDIPASDRPTVRTFITIYDARGRLVRRLFDEDVPAGSYRIHWDGKSDSGESLPSGIYLLHLKAGVESGMLKMMLAR